MAKGIELLKISSIINETAKKLLNSFYCGICNGRFVVLNSFTAFEIIIVTILEIGTVNCRILLIYLTEINAGVWCSVEVAERKAVGEGRY